MTVTTVNVTGPPFHRSSLVGVATTRLIRTKLINHVTVVLDASGSMHRHAAAVKAQLKTLVEDLAAASKELDQETRVTVYSFSTETRVLVFDTDVLRLPPVDELYEVLNDRTALYDATAVALDDLGTTSTIYGDHAFLVYLITDGLENASHLVSDAVVTRVQGLGENWTVGALVPDPAGRREVEALGVPTDNIRLWDVHSKDGFVGAGAAVRSATRSYMQSRASGVRGTRSLFSTGADAVNPETVAVALTPMQPGSYVLAQTGDYRGRIDDFVNRVAPPFMIGTAYYEYTKREEIQAQKKIVIVNRHTGEVFHDPTPSGNGRGGSPKVRDMVGLPHHVSVKERPDFNPEFKVFVQSTAPNRVVLPGTEVLIVK